MKIKSNSFVVLLSLWVLIVFSGLQGCSRGDAIQEKSKLLDHSMAAIVLKQRPENLEAFLDSIREMDTLILQDTINATVNDSLFLLGIFDGQEKNIAVFTWRLASLSDSGFAQIERTTPGEIRGIAFEDSALYRAVFVATDRIGGKDSTNNPEKNYHSPLIRILNTPPESEFFMDTVWSSRKSLATATFFAADSYGVIRSVKADWNSDGEWDTTLANIADTMSLGIPYDSAATDSNFLQQVVFSLEDEDGNTTLDTMQVHFNVPPEVSLTFPFDDGMVDVFKPFKFVWDLNDPDNADSVQYIVRVSKAERPSRNDEVSQWIRDKHWQAIDETDTLLQMDTSLTGRLYWQVMARDGYDTTLSDVYTFYLGDLNLTTGFIQGVAQFEGLSTHQGIRVIAISYGGEFIFSANTTADGEFFMDQVEPGYYRLQAADTLGAGWPVVIRDSIEVRLGEFANPDTLLLQDNKKPLVFATTVIDTAYYNLPGRSLTFEGVFRDSGSQVNPAEVMIEWNGLNNAFTADSWNWSTTLENIPDGIHRLSVSATDYAGNVSDTLTATFLVKATKLNVLVNGKSSDIVGLNEDLVFTASGTNVNPPFTEFYWYLTEDGSVSETDTTAATSSTGTITKNLALASLNGQMVVRAINDSNMAYQDTVNFKVLDGDDPSVIFEQPAGDTTISIKDSVTFRIFSLDPNGSIDQVQWDFDADGVWDQTGDSASTSETGFRYNTPGNFDVVVQVTDNDAITATDTLLVEVLLDAPVVSVSPDEFSVSINDSVAMNVTASDGLGSIVAYEWNCGGAGWQPDADGDTVVYAPAVADPDWMCIIRVTDDDGNQSSDTAHINVQNDPPSVQVSRERDTVTVNDSVSVNAVASDGGAITKYEWKCGDNAWQTTSTASHKVKAPASPDANWLCIIRVTDDDSQTARDTMVIDVRLAPPIVNVVEDSLQVGISDPISLRMVAVDSNFNGSIEKYEWSCGSTGSGGVTGWITTSGADTTWTAPSTGTGGWTWLCVVRVTDDDDNQSRDSTWVNVGQFPPTISLSADAAQYTILDNVTLTASATDPGGTIVSYEYSCDGNPWNSASGATQVIVAPADSVTGYECAMRVTDDDGQIAADTVSFNVILDPPSVVMDQDSLTAAVSTQINLSAVASDGFGTIEKYEWSCGGAGVAGVTNWKRSGSADTSITAPLQGTVGYDYLCIIRVTDDDALTAQDTTWIQVTSSGTALMNADDEAVYVRAGENTQLGASVNEVVQIDKFDWACADEGQPISTWTQTAQWDNEGDSLIGSLNYIFSAPANEDLTYYCVARLTDQSAQVLYDTVSMYIFVPPEAIITAVDSLFMWSGNTGIPDRFSTIIPYVNGSASTPGTWGDGDIDTYEWRFIRRTTTPSATEYNAGYEGNDDGTLWFFAPFVIRDSTIRENDDFMNIYIKLDVQDTVMPNNPDQIFLNRHVDVAFHQITFYRAWEKLGTAPVNALGDAVETGVAVTRTGNVMTLTQSGSTIRVDQLSGSSWAQVGGDNVSTDGDQPSIAAYGDSVLVSWTNSSGQGEVSISEAGGNWSKYNQRISDCIESKILPDTTNGDIYVVCRDAANELTLYARSGNSWSVQGSAGNASNAETVSEFDAYISHNNSYIVSGWVSGGSFKARRFDVGTGSWQSARTVVSSGASRVSIAVDNSGLIWAGANVAAKPVGYKQDGSSFTQLGPTALAAEGFYHQGTDVALDAAGNFYLTYEEGLNLTAHYSSVWKFPAGGSDWELFGEDLLPWFNKPYNGSNYVRSKSPQILAAPNGRVYVSFRIEENNGGTTYNGSMVMRYR